jgi:hypothetical protein
VRSSRPSRIAFGAVVALAATLAIGYVFYKVAQRAAASDEAARVHTAVAGSKLAAGALSHAPTTSLDPAQAYVLYRHTSSGDNGQGEVWQAALDTTGTPNQANAQQQSLRCNRSYFAGGQGLCLRSDFDGAWQTVVRVVRFDAAHNVTDFGQYPGIPSRTRVSRDGMRGAFTIFVVGHSYASAGFSTQTMLGQFDDPASWVPLETYQVFRADGSMWREIDFNFWGVTFTSDSNVFYATLGSGGHAYLVKGDMTTRQAHILREGVECPSLSPDGTRLAFKHALQPGFWSIHVLTPATGQETTLDVERRNVDDQIEWLNNSDVLYGLPNDRDPSAWDIWRLSTDGKQAPTLFLADAASPAVVRP